VTPAVGYQIDPTGERTIITFLDPGAVLMSTLLPPADVLLEDCDAVLTPKAAAHGLPRSLRRGSPARHSPVSFDSNRGDGRFSEGLLNAWPPRIWCSLRPLQYTKRGADRRRPEEIQNSRRPSFRHPAAPVTIWLDEHGDVRRDAAFRSTP